MAAAVIVLNTSCTSMLLLSFGCSDDKSTLGIADGPVIGVGFVLKGYGAERT